jgi:hypothetical protein
MSFSCRSFARECGDLAAVERCVAEKIREGCGDRGNPFCPSSRLFKAWKRYGIEEREWKLLRDDLLGIARLDDRLPMRAMRSRVNGKPADGGMKGNEALVVLGGQCGAGKTLAASWGLSRTGGKYITACDLSGIDIDLGGLLAARTLVIDQLGTESSSESGWWMSRFLNVVDRRYAANRLTVLIGNLYRKDFDNDYGPPFARRLRDNGVFVFCEDPKRKA